MAKKKMTVVVQIRKERGVPGSFEVRALTRYFGGKFGIDAAYERSRAVSLSKVRASFLRALVEKVETGKYPDVIQFVEKTGWAK